jgi:hypothetical protein
VRPRQLPDDIRALLAEARPFDEPSTVDRERIGRALAHTLGTPAQAWIEAPEVLAAKTTLFGVKLIGLLAVLGLGTFFAVHERVSPPSAGASAAETRVLDLQPSAASGMSEAEAAGRSQPLAARAAPLEQPSSNAAHDQGSPANQHPRSGRASRPATNAARSDQVRSPRSRSANAGSHIAGTDSNAVAPRSPLGDPALAEPSASAASSTPNEPLARSRPTSAAAAGPELQAELNLITTASRALDAHDLPRAAQALHTHADRFASGFLREEREALRAMLACERGDTSATALRGAFERNYPRSPERLRIAQHCDGRPRSLP